MPYSERARERTGLPMGCATGPLPVCFAGCTHTCNSNVMMLLTLASCVGGVVLWGLALERVG